MIELTSLVLAVWAGSRIIICAYILIRIQMDSEELERALLWGKQAKSVGESFRLYFKTVYACFPERCRALVCEFTEGMACLLIAYLLKAI